MAVEVFYNAIRITGKDNSNIEAIIKDASGSAITSGNIYFVIPEANIRVKGTYNNDRWIFVVPSSELQGRYIYHFELDGIYLDFGTAIYFE